MTATEHVVSRGYTEVDYTDFAHTGPGTLAGRYLRTFWQPVYVARDLPREQAEFMAFGKDHFARTSFLRQDFPCRRARF